MLQYPCASPRPRRGPGEVSSVSGLQLSTTIAPDLFLLVAAAGRSSSQLVSKVHDQAGHRHKTSPAPAQDHPLSSPAPAHPLSNTPQQGQVSSPRVRISNHKCGATVSVESILDTHHSHSCSSRVRGLSILLSLPKSSVIRHHGGHGWWVWRPCDLILTM